MVCSVAPSFLRFGVLFFALLLSFSVLSVATDLQNHLHVVEIGLAGAATRMAGWTGSVATVNDNIIHAGPVAMDINHECTGVFVLFVLVSFVAAYPAPWRAKLAGMAVGIAALTFINALRIATLIRLVEWQPTLFDYFHEYVWQGAFLMLVTVYAFAWVEWVRQ